MDIRDLIETYLNEKEADEFSIWAIGVDFKEISYQDWPKLWNEKHGDIFKIYPRGTAKEDLKPMIRLWRNETKSS